MMAHIPMIGLHGKAGAGKDTVYDRLRELGGPKYVRRSIADPMKESIAALFDCSLDELEQWKRERTAMVALGHDYDDEGVTISPTIMLTMREFMQRYGTEAHRGVFGQDFWLDFWMRQWADTSAQGEVWVNTSVRFENEARRIRDVGGEVWLIKGPHDGVEGHESEVQLPDEMIDRVIDNSARKAMTFKSECGQQEWEEEADFSHLDAQVQAALDQLGLGCCDETTSDRPHYTDNCRADMLDGSTAYPST